MRGDGRGILAQLNARALDALVAYLNDGRLSPTGASCQQNVPFASR